MNYMNKKFFRLRSQMREEKNKKNIKIMRHESLLMIEQIHHWHQ